MAQLINKMKYQKPQIRNFDNMLSAEGFCITGRHAYGRTCTDGPDTSSISTNTLGASYCSPGGVAEIASLPPICPSGAEAANCFSGAAAGG